ncbi:MAG: class I SAM-dependent methyltransferase [Deltaproteobacteria bacterium]|nr:class I SAM-dependent methyltransferase [Deltaproteobacteria bacterium]
MTKNPRQEILEKAEAARQKHLEAGLYTEEEEARLAEMELKLPGADLPPMRRLEEVQFRLSQSFSPSALPEFTSHRPGLGQLIVAVKRLAYRLARPWLSILLASQVQFNRHLVDFSHEVVDSSNRLEEKVDSTLQRVVRLVRRVEAGAPAQPGPPPAMPDLPDLEYLALEDRHRGSPQEIAARQAGYLEFFREAPGPVLDLGCGRGEFLELLAQAGIEARGVDSNPEMVSEAQARGVKAERTEGIGHLQSLAQASLGGLFLAQVIEHLNLAQLTALLEAAFKALAPGGVILAETINPQSLITFASAFYLDPTHRRPIHPEAARFLLESAGFKGVSVIPVNPVPEEIKLRPVSRFLPGARAMNDNINRLNGLLFGDLDYAIVGKR